MSQKIQDVLEVLKQVQSRFDPSTSLYQVSKVRIDAVQYVAKKRGVKDRTINDACVRRLEPEVSGTDKFDELIWEWLNGRSQKIKLVLQRHIIDQDDESQIAEFFSV
jgi:3-polyprenyl-4-hydroxybenzoate decarboxylase